MGAETSKDIEEAIRLDGRYPPAAYEFLHHGLAYTTRCVHDVDAGKGPRHVTGRQLCEGLRALAVKRWGPLARTVLGGWNVRTTRDFGEMVYLLVELGLMGKQDSDRIEDFDDVYDFRDAFQTCEIPLDKFDTQH